MGLIHAALGAASGVLADQWKEYFYCEAIPADVLAVKGQKRVSGRSSNRHGNDNIISSGSVIAVADGQCMLIVDQGKVAEVCAEPGEFVYDASTEPSVFNGPLGEGIKEVFKQIGKRFTFGGEAPKDQRVYYFNTKEILGNKYGTPNPVPFRVVDARANIDIDVGMRCFGEYSYKVINPILLYTNVTGNFADEYNRSQLDSQLKSELLTALQPAFARIGEQGVRYSALLAHTTELTEALKAELSSKWAGRRGIEIESFGISSITANEEDEKMLKDLQRAAALRDPSLGAGYITGATGEALQDAAKNPGGAAATFYGVNMAGNIGGGLAQSLYGQAAAQPQQQAAAPAADSWTCACGTVNSGNFCTKCGNPKPAAWTCSCGAVNDGNFCPKCGKPKPVRRVCSKCGAELPADGQFCPKCGQKAE